MKRQVLVCTLAIVLLAGTGQGPTGAQPPADGEKIVRFEVQALRQAWQFSGVDLPKGHYATIRASGAWDINPINWGKTVGAGGNIFFQAGAGYVKPGANEGCLLVRSGDTVLAFANDGALIKISTPGKIYFCANDLPNEAGAAAAKDVPNALPIPAAPGAEGNGFQDNSGSLRVHISVQKSGS